VPSRNAVQRAFDAYGAANFAEKKSGTWRRTCGELEQSLNLQKSQYSLRYYLNVKLVLLPGGEGAGIEGRAGSLLGAEDADRLERLLDVDGSDMPGERREAGLLAVLDRLTVVLNKLNTVEAVTTAERQGALAGMGVRGPARVLIDGMA
jgi:hypothetical protein